MGLKANVVTKKFDTIIDDLGNKRFDVVISAVTINPDRQKKADFIPYFNAGESLLVQAGNPKNIKSVSDLCGQSVGVQTGTVEQTDLQTASDACKKAGKPAIKLTVLQDQTAVVQLLANGRVVATYQDSPVTDYYNKQHPGQFAVGGSVVNAAEEGIVVRKGDTSMFTAVKLTSLEDSYPPFVDIHKGGCLRRLRIFYLYLFRGSPLLVQVLLLRFFCCMPLLSDDCFGVATQHREAEPQDRLPGHSQCQLCSMVSHWTPMLLRGSRCYSWSRPRRSGRQSRRN